jgi:hypothetical protein
MFKDDKDDDNGTKRVRVVDVDEEEDTTTTAASNTNKSGNAFSIMMKAATRREYFILDERTMRCDWIITETPRVRVAEEVEEDWCCKVNLGTRSSGRREVQLIRIHSRGGGEGDNTVRYQRVNSRLSVGTLKSVLQKSVRRRNVAAAAQCVVSDWVSLY